MSQVGSPKKKPGPDGSGQSGELMRRTRSSVDISLRSPRGVNCRKPTASESGAALIATFTGPAAAHKVLCRGHWGFPGEFLKYGGRADLVSGEFWLQNPYWDLGIIECRGASATANTYGLPIGSAEAFTAGFNFSKHTGIMKERGDWAFC